MTDKVKQHYWFVSVLGRSVFPGDPSGPACLSIRAGAIRASESGSIPSCHGDKIKAFRQPKRSLPCALAHNVPLLKHPVAMEMQLWPFKSFLGPAVSLGHWHTHTQTHNALTRRLINIYTCTLLSGALFPSNTHSRNTHRSCCLGVWLMRGHDWPGRKMANMDVRRYSKTAGKAEPLLQNLASNTVTDIVKWTDRRLTETHDRCVHNTNTDQSKQTRRDVQKISCQTKPTPPFH